MNIQLMWRSLDWINIVVIMTSMTHHHNNVCDDDQDVLNCHDIKISNTFLRHDPHEWIGNGPSCMERVMVVRSLIWLGLLKKLGIDDHFLWVVLVGPRDWGWK